MKRRIGFLLAATTLASAAAAPASAQNTDRSVLPVPAAPFTGTIAENIADAKGAPETPIRAPQGAPNVFLMMSDDVGFAMSSAFGGPVPTPNFDRLAAQGQRYNRFHTTGICSPSRAALLTGRNHHAAGVGWLSDVPAPFPGYTGRISPETATIAQVLRLNGYNTAMFGKHHNVPSGERSAAGPFDTWPTGLGFEYFFGFPYGDSDQYSPILYRDTQRVEPDPGEGRLLDARLSDDIIRWVHNQKAGAPDKPFLIYLAPGSTHAPHQAPPEYIARFKGKFDKGWDVVREETFRRQLAAGIVPRGTKLTARPAEVPAWDSLTPGQKAFAARTMEVAAAQLVYQDEQIGRVIAELERMGELDKTLVAMVLGDNGASAEAGPKGTINELRGMGRHDEDEAWMQANTDKLGGPDTYESYPAGWTWAMNTPLRWTKQYASMLGGIRNGMILSWQGHVARPGAVCSQFAHLNDMAPTLLEAAHLPAPDMVLGARQKPMDGRSLLPSLAACDGAKPRTQYFEIGGKIGLYHDGWFLSGDDGRLAWENLPPGGARPNIQWSLYDLSKDFSQSTDLAAKEPARLQAMLALWQQEAKRNNVFPLDHRFAMARGAAAMRGSGRKHFDFWGKDVSIPSNAEPTPIVRSFTLTADLNLASPTASGAVTAYGSKFGGWSLYLDQGRPAFVAARSTDPKEISRVIADKALPQGVSKLTLRFAVEKMAGPAMVTLSADGTELAKLQIPTSMLLAAGNGETLDIGRDLGVTVTDYRTPHGAIEGDIPHVSFDFD
ncbi:arylsulfatase [Novosphingobium sp. JCM 18896]|uniref:arylsulfatase n=1 Tax=Novosphingobium sp. JCM 18896 TaxID=2989731 RepID=UPI002221C789|nr:arylsulfatase [Novosphingobium sp. JCM 18896]MCW1428622.1 arylsulfatase [Novosphingobium sp. JCM 18896]